METIELRRLLSRRVVTDLLEQALELLPGVRLSVQESGGQLLAAVGEGAPTAAGPLTCPLLLSGEPVGLLVAEGSGVQEAAAATVLALLQQVFTRLLERAIENRSLAQETLERYREINLLYNIGETISATLDPEAVPHLVLAEASRIIYTDVGIVLLLDEAGVLVKQAGIGGTELEVAFELAVRPSLAEALLDGRPKILTLEPEDSGVAAVQSVLFAPLKTRERVLGFVLLGRLAERSIFTAGEEKLLMALAGQAAVAVENARLFADVKRQRDAIAEMKNYMDNIFASIASGVITTDVQDLVTILNRAAERILRVNANETMGKPYLRALPGLGPRIAALVDTVKEQDQSVVGYELESELPDRGPVVLQVHLSPLKDNHEQTTGIAIVVDDLTEQRHLEEQVRQVRGTFERYVAPRVVEQLLSDPDRVRLGGVRQEVTILFADVRGFTTFSEKADPEFLVGVLNRHLTLAAEAILAEDGTLDKFIGDAVMAIFNAPLAQPDHALRAVRAALTMQRRVAELHGNLPVTERLSFGAGIVTGLAVVGNVGSPVLQNYTAIGDSVNLASRLQTYAQPGQILMSTTAYAQVCEHVVARELGYVQLKGHSEPDLVLELLGLRES